MVRPASSDSSTTTVWPAGSRAQQQRLGERVLDHVLDHAPQRPRAVVDVVAQLDDVVLGLLGDRPGRSAAPAAARARGRAAGRRSRGSPRRSASGRPRSESTRFRNSGRNCVLSWSRTFSFIRSYCCSRSLLLGVRHRPEAERRVLEQRLRADVAGHDDDRVAEVDPAALGVASGARPPGSGAGC